MADARAVLDFAADLAVCVDGVQLADRVRALTDLVAAEGVLATSTVGWMSELTLDVGDPTIYRPELMQAVGRAWDDHPVMPADLARSRSGARRISDHTPGRAWRRCALFNDFYRPLGMQHELSLQLAWGPAGTSRCVALQRGGRDFGERERARLELIAPHLRAAEARVTAAAQVASLEEDCSAAGLARRLPITPREAEVLAGLATGLTNDGIAHELGISRHTVVRHVESLYAKLDVHTRAAATRVALGAGRPSRPRGS